MGILTEVTCIPLEIPEPPPQFEVPFLGQLQLARDSLYRMPDPSNYMMQAMNQLQLAMAPLRQWLELLEAVMLIKNCQESIPKAIMRLSPQPIFDCLKQLVKVIARLLSYFPPMPYVKALVDICRIMALVLDTIVELLEEVDARITELKQNIAYAESIGDTALIDFHNCGSGGDLKFMAISMCDILATVSNPISLFLEPVLRYIDNAALRKALTDIVTGGDVVALKQQIEDMAVGEIYEALGPALGLQMNALAAARVGVVQIHNIVGVVVGADPLPQPEMPTFSNLVA